MRGSADQSSSVRRKRSAGLCTLPFATTCSMSLSPRPWMSSALREAKWISACTRCAWQCRPPEQRATASPSGRMTSEAQTGQCVGMVKGWLSAGRFSRTTLTISGMTSPARRTKTVSPTRTSLRATSSALCRVALVTVTPPTSTACRRATGVTAPVRPTCTSMASTMVVFSTAGNFHATAQRGARETNPAVCCSAKRSAL